jgi:hypothetical protein
LSKSSESGHPSLAPYFRQNANNFSPFSIMLGIGLPDTAFGILRYNPYIPGLF